MVTSNGKRELDSPIFCSAGCSPECWGPSGCKNRSALRPFLTSPLRAPTLFDIAAPRSTIFLRSKLRPFLHQRSALRPFFESVLRAPTFLHQRSALRHINTKNRRSALRPILHLALRAPRPPLDGPQRSPACSLFRFSNFECSKQQWNNAMPSNAMCSELLPHL